MVSVRQTTGAHLTLLVSPMRASRLGLGFALPAAVVVLSESDREIVVPEQALSRAYGLTSAEARLLSALVAGQKLSDYMTAGVLPLVRPGSI